MSNSTLSLSSALKGGGWSTTRLDRFNCFNHSFACWECMFKFHRGQGCLPVVSAVCCQAAFCASGESYRLWFVVVCVLETS